MTAPERQTLELREEVLTVEKQRDVYAQVTLRRERRVRTEVVQLELVSEVLVIAAQPGGPAVMVDGTLLQAGETRELVLYEERALPGKDVVVTQEVHVRKAAQTEWHTEDVELAYEELVVERSPQRTSQDQDGTQHQPDSSPG
ncbi:stress response protein YsnF [Deinococcus metalli]|uniref:Stress response protein YsnF n=1 Tax=Deinococcus metalli TaxID=1141878 RepID=A0A7W8NPH6_9DEIO|nr:DUF2382 domain-containing protein [Deinococcus metalli]MBB5378004.1 stress response protein YsnF [Deinococcus metalli]GHF53721.1 hypothetical protein GCM10017781_32440 [Deinococcus metalli]